MVRSKSKIYGEVNNPDTILADAVIDTDKFIVGSGNKGIELGILSPNQLLVINSDGTVTGLALGVANKAIATDGAGNVILIDKAV